MAKRLKLKFSRAIHLSRVIPSIQFCRSKNPSVSVHTPVPAVYRLSPVNSKVIDINFPNNNNNNLPAPPPTTPAVGHFIKRHVSTNAMSVECSCRTQELSPEYMWKKDSALCHVAVSKDHEPKHKKKKTISSVSSRDSGCFSCSEEEDVSEAIISASTRSLANYSSTELEHSPETRKKKKVNTNYMKQIRRHGYEESDMTVAGVVSPAKGSVFPRTIPSTVDGKVRESVAVVKTSVDPYEDFKKSMLEMILQKQMFEAKDLEQLLLCFLSLNSKKYHQVIVEAFSDIWEILFCD